MEEIMRTISDTITSFLGKNPSQWTLKEGGLFIAKIALGFFIFIAAMLLAYAIFRLLRKVLGGTKKLIFGKNRRGV